MRTGPQDSRSPPQPGQALTSGSPMAESNPAETRTSSGLNCRQGPVGRGRKEAGAEAEGRPLQRDPPHPRGSVPLWAPHRPHPLPLRPPPPPHGHLKGHGQQHMQEGGHVVSISHPDLWPRGISAGPAREDGRVLTPGARALGGILARRPGLALGGGGNVGWGRGSGWGAWGEGQAPGSRAG